MVKYMEASAKTGDGVKAIVEAVSEYEKVANKEPPPEPEPAASKATTRSEKSGCNVC